MYGFEIKSTRQKEICLFIFFGVVLFVLHFKWLTLPFHSDTANFLIPAAKSITNSHNPLMYFGYTDYPHTPLLPNVVAVVMAMTHDHVFWVHVLGVCMSWIFLITMYFLGKIIAGPMAGVLLSLLFITNPLFVAQTHMVYFEIIGSALRYIALLLLLKRHYLWFVLIGMLAIGVRIDNSMFLILGALFYGLIFPLQKSKARWILNYISPLFFVSIFWFILHYFLAGWWFYSPDRYFIEDHWGALVKAIQYTLFFQGRWLVGFLTIVLFFFSIYRKKKIEYEIEKKRLLILSMIGVASVSQLLFISKLGYVLERYTFPILPFYFLCFICVVCSTFGTKKIILGILVVMIMVIQHKHSYVCNSSIYEDCLVITDFLAQKQKAINVLEELSKDKIVAISQEAYNELSNTDVGFVSSHLLTTVFDVNNRNFHYLYVTPNSDSKLQQFAVENNLVLARSFVVPYTKQHINIYENSYIKK